MAKLKYGIGLLILTIPFMLWADDCPQPHLYKNGSHCVHRCQFSTNQIWDSDSQGCVDCPDGQVRNQSSNSCTEIHTCDNGDSPQGQPRNELVDSQQGNHYRQECRHRVSGDSDDSDDAQFVKYYVNIMTGRRTNQFWQELAQGQYPQICTNDQNEPVPHLIRDTAGTCRHACAEADGTSSPQEDEANEPSRQFLSEDGVCRGCPHGKIANNDNECVCKEGTYNEFAESCIPQDVADAITAVEALCSQDGDAQQSECEQKCTLMHQHYQRSGNRIENAQHCGGYFPANVGQGTGGTQQIPDGWSWSPEGPNLIRTSVLQISGANCGRNFEVCWGRAVGPVTLPNGETRQTSAMIKCIVPRNSTACPTDISGNRDCAEVSEVNPALTRVATPQTGGVDCNDSTPPDTSCKCSGRLVASATACDQQNHISYINQHCRSVENPDDQCRQHCFGIGNVHSACASFRQSATDDDDDDGGDT